MKNISVNTQESTISFSGLTYANWSHIRWLRDQLSIMEMNAEALWGSEDECARRVISEHRAGRFTVIDGGKEE